MQNRKSLLFFFLIFTGILLYDCSGHQETKVDDDAKAFRKSLSNPEFAKGFKISENGSAKLVEIFYPGDSTNVAKKYWLIDENDDQTSIPAGGVVIRIPAKSMVCLSATHLSFAGALELLNKVTGVSSADYVVSQEFQNLVKSGVIKEIGIGDHFKLEQLIALHPDFVMVSPQAGQGYTPLENAGITVVPNGDYLETTPLGQAEWIKFMAVFFNKEKEAKLIFDSIKSAYNSLKILTKNVEYRPTVLSGKQYGGFWDLPGGKSFVAQFIHDAGARYVYTDNQETGSLTLDFETVYAMGIEADFWRFLVYSPDDFTLETLRREDVRYADFKAFKEKKVLACNTLKKPYYQKGLLEPQLILADYIKIFHPELLPGYQNHYYELIP
jgi:iron complex transport system substrate-binding protein